MKKKVFQLFCGKEKELTSIFFILLAISAIYTMYHLTLITGTYKKWEPVIQLEKDWYFYPHVEFQEDEVQGYLRDKYKAISLDEFRGTKFPAKEQFYDVYSYGMLFETNENEVEKVKGKYQKAETIVPLTAITERECRFFEIIDVSHFAAWLILWFITIITAMVWFRRCLWKSREEIRCLLFLGYNKKNLKKLYGGFIGWFIPVIWLISGLAVFIPGKLEIWFRKLYLSALFENALILILVYGVIYIWTFRNWAKDEWQEVMKETDAGHLSINELSFVDNLKLALLIQGFSERFATEVVMTKMKEREIAFCAKRPMSQVVGDERVQFFKIQDELLHPLDE